MVCLYISVLLNEVQFLFLKQDYTKEFTEWWWRKISKKKKKLPWTVYRVLKNLSLEFRNWCKFPGIPRTWILFWSEACWQVSLDYAILKFLLFQAFLCVTPEYVLCWGVAFVVFTLGMGGECDWESCPRTTYLLANNQVLSKGCSMRSHFEVVVQSFLHLFFFFLHIFFCFHEVFTVLKN